MNYCASQPEGVGFVSSMVRFVDCQSQALGFNAWQALSQPGSTLAVVLTGFLTIYIALIGYNLLLGRALTVRGGTLAAIKIGAVFALATSWPAYRTMVYDLVVDGPAELVNDIGSPSGVPGSDGTLVQRLDLADGALAQLAIRGAGAAIGKEAVPPPIAGFDAFAIGGSRILFLISAIAGLGVVRVVAGLMLALGPFFIAFLLFDSTRSLFEGWVRVLAGAALAAVGVSIALGLELSILEPWLASVLARRGSGEALPSAPTELFVISCVFALAVAAIVFACVWLTRAFRLAPLIAHTTDLAGARSAGPRERGAFDMASNSSNERTRARAVADVLVSLQWREASGLGAPGSWRTPALAPAGNDLSRPARQAQVPVGRSFRRSRPRLSPSAGKRDSR